MRPRQVPVEHDYVISGDRQRFQRVVAAEDHINGHALATQSCRYGPREDFEVLGDQYSHASTMPQPTVSTRCHRQARW